VSGYATLNQLCSTASENRFIKMLLNVARGLRHRWLVLRFGQRLYDQACSTQSAVVDSSRRSAKLLESTWRSNVLRNTSIANCDRTNSISR